VKKVLTYTIIAGSKACTHDCPICISKMTPDFGIGPELPDVNWDRFRKATTIALNHGAENVLLTGKGEPTLFPGQITRFLIGLHGRPFDRRELQTNGSLLAKGGLYDDFLLAWGDLGLDTVAISIYHYDGDRNRELFRPRGGEYLDLPALIGKVHSRGMNTRLSCVMLSGGIDTVDAVKKLIHFARDHGVHQLTLRTADRPRNSRDRATAEFIDSHRLGPRRLATIRSWLEKEGQFCDDLPHGALVYEIFGQNVCITTGLTRAQRMQREVRQLIFFPQGWLTSSWENVMGGRIL